MFVFKSYKLCSLCKLLTLQHCWTPFVGVLGVFSKDKLFHFLSQSYSSLLLLGLGQRLVELLCNTHSVTVLEDFSRLKASWYLRLSTSFFIWGRSISSMVAAWCGAFLPVHSSEARVIFIQHVTLFNSRQTRSIQLCPAARTPRRTSDL